MALSLAPLLAGCAGSGYFGSAAPGAPAPSLTGSGAAAMPAGSRVAILLPLSGPNAFLGQSMLKAAKLALDQPGSPALDARDTGGTPQGAAAAARAAVAGGDGMILGPLTSTETAAVAPVAQQANLPVLAFTSDLSQARPGIWVMGITPEQQAARLVAAAKAEGRTHIAAILPDGAFGAALAEGLQRAAAEQGLPPPSIVRHDDGFRSINEALRQVSDYADRRGGLDAKVKAARASHDAAGRAEAAQLAGQPVPPPPFDTLMIGATGVPLQEIISLLAFYDIHPSQTRILGPGLWAAFAVKLHALAGAWYAAPDPQARGGFVQLYTARYGQAPRPLSDIPYDAAALVRSVAATGGNATLTRGEGFAGVDGVFALQPDGHVRRGLAIFQIAPGGGAQLVQPAPGSLSGS